jgi:anti-anti-sigma factor
MLKQLFVRRDRDGVVVLKILERELSDLVLQDKLGSALTEFVQTHRPRKMLLDLSDVDYCATGVINTFLMVRKLVVDQGGEFKLCSLSESLRIAFRSLNLEKTVFSIHESADESIEAFNDPTL